LIGVWLRVTADNSLLFRRHKTKPYFIENRRWDPVTATTSVFFGLATDMTKSATDIIVKPIKTYRQQSKLKRSDLESQLTLRTASAGPQSPGLALPQADPLPRRARSTRGCASSSGAVLMAGVSGVGGFFRSFSKGFYVDMPMAVADGFRSVPRLYGEAVPERPPITDWKSGALEGGRNLVVGISGGLADLVVQPHRGAKQGGATGAAVGFGKGLVGMASKTVSGEYTAPAPRKVWMYACGMAD
jgi:hypothetical protein